MPLFEEGPVDVRTRGDVLTTLLDLVERIDLSRVLPSSIELPNDVRVIHIDDEEAFGVLYGATVGSADGSHISREMGLACLGVHCSVGLFFNEPFKLSVDRSRMFQKEGIHLLAADSGRAWVSVREATDTYEVARVIVETFEPDIIMVDGPLLIRPGLITISEGGVDLLSNRRYVEDLGRCAMAVLSLLEICREKGTSVVGFVKRPRSRLLARRMGLRVRDIAILGPKTRIGDVVCIGGAGKHPALALYSRLGERAGLPFVREGDWIQVAYIRTTRRRIFRLEYPKWDDVRRIAGFIMAYAPRGREGVPAPIVLADNMCKTGGDALKSARRRLMRRWLEEGREVAFQPMIGHEL